MEIHLDICLQTFSVQRSEQVSEKTVSTVSFEEQIMFKDK